MSNSVLKYRVTMRNDLPIPHEAVDRVPEDILESYVEDARTRWTEVYVSETPEPEGN